MRAAVLAVVHQKIIGRNSKATKEEGWDLVEDADVTGISAPTRDNLECSWDCRAYDNSFGGVNGETEA